MALLDRLQKATFKGVPFFVENSAITFGQKTVTHQYPNSNRTEVEFLGAAEDSFTIDLFINATDNDYIARRNQLKAILLEGGIGLLVHPYEGSVLCSVVGRPTVTESDKEFGIAKFTVTFQKTSKKLFPTSSILNSAVIRNLFGEFGTELSSSVEGGVSADDTYQTVFLNTKSKMDSLSTIFTVVQSIVPLSESLASDFNSKLTSFYGNIVSMSQSPELLAASLDDVFGAMDLLAASPIDNVTIQQQFFDFSDDDEIIPPITVEQETINNNNFLIKQYVQAKALSLAYVAIATVTFGDDQTLDYYENILEQQYQKVIAYANSDINYSLSLLRNQVRIYFNNQKVRQVINIEIPKMPLTVLTYSLYGSLTDFDTLYALNQRANPALYSGTVKVLTEA